jgi:hypothetical protein
MIGKILLPIVENFSQKGRTFNLEDTMNLLKMYKVIYWSWGAKNPINYYDKVLILSVNGRYHKGKILIRLNGWDLYDVMFVTSQNKIRSERKDIFFDDLITVIDNCIESNPRGFEMYT